MRIFYEKGTGRIKMISRGGARSAPLSSEYEVWEVPPDLDIPRGETHVIFDDQGRPIGTTRWTKEARKASSPGEKSPDFRPKVACLSLLPPIRSGISDYTLHWIRKLSKVWNIQAYSPTELDNFDPTPYDYIIAHIGNSEHHVKILKVAASIPCILLIHDADLSCLIPLTGGGMFQTALRKAEAVLAHSRVVLDSIDHPNKHLVPFVVDEDVLDHNRAKKQVLRELETEADRLVLIAGGIAPHKNILQCMDILEDRRDLYLLIVGYGGSPYAEQVISRSEDMPNCTVLTDVGSDGFRRYLAAADVLLHLRNPTAGETSHAVVRALNQGTPVVVWDHGWYSTLPDDVAVKVKGFEDVPSALEEALSKGRVSYETEDPVPAYLKVQESIERRIALISPGHIGDILVLDSAVQGLREKYRNVRVAIVAPERYRGVINRDVEHIPCDKFISEGGFIHRGFEDMETVDQNELRDTWSKFHRVYNLRSPDAVSFYKSIPEAGLRRRYCWYVGVADVYSPRVPFVPVNPECPRPILVIHARGGRPHKYIPDEILEELRDSPDWYTVVVGGEESRDLPANRNRAGELTLLGTSGWIWAADAVLCVDSWVMHAALALDKPTVSVWRRCGDDWYLPERVLHPTERDKPNHIILLDPTKEDILNALRGLRN